MTLSSNRRRLARATRFALDGALLLLLAFASAAAALEQKLTASDGAALDELGSSVAIDGTTIVAGAPGDVIGANLGQGSLYTFARTGGAARLETAKLTASGGATGDNLGSSVAIDGDTIVAGAENREVGSHAFQGAAYMFASAGPAARAQTAELTASDGTNDDEFGTSVAIDGDTIVAGAPPTAAAAPARHIRLPERARRHAPRRPS